MRVLITGSSGLVGRSLRREMTKAHFEIVPFDIANSPAEDIRLSHALKCATGNVEGVVHLAAIARVNAAQANPGLCHSVNELALDTLLEHLRYLPRPPWIIFASSREVYGDQHAVPVSESAEPAPKNVYCHSKLAGERLILAARSSLPAANVVRLSNVYGDSLDYSDRVFPAFASKAAFGGEIVVRGSEVCLDFVHVDDVVDGLIRLISKTMKEENAAVIHLASGVGTTLKDLSELAQLHTKAQLRCVTEYSSRFQVSRFIGDPLRAFDVLGWRSQINVANGFERLVSDFQASLSTRKARGW